MRISATVLALLACWSAAAPAAVRGDTPFVVTYHCDRDRWLAIGYPAFKDARREPIRLTWEGRTVELAPTRRTGSGARYVNVRENLEWWSKGNGGSLSAVHPNRRDLVTGCVER